MKNTRRIVISGLACLLLASPAAAAQPIPYELRAPDITRDAKPLPLDVRDAAEPLPQDFRSPDARDAAERPAQDFRSPDARDAADPTPPVGEPVIASAPPVEVASPGTDWVLITLAASGYLLAVAVVALSAARGRRRIAV